MAPVQPVQMRAPMYEAEKRSARKRGEKVKKVFRDSENVIPHSDKPLSQPCFFFFYLFIF